jgi:hypothetical protein
MREFVERNGYGPGRRRDPDTTVARFQPRPTKPGGDMEILFSMFKQVHDVRKSRYAGDARKARRSHGGHRIPLRSHDQWPNGPSYTGQTFGGLPRVERIAMRVYFST